ncbi:MAG: hypothetical protein IJ592_02630 [Candidatus Methanomethylophilaceae archaeon]|nr:hypothetical protein [Candidatus Methanomethylophilaceae archaeon]
MNKAAFGIMALLALAAFCLVPAGADAAGEITHDGTNVYKVSTSEDFTIVYTYDAGQTGEITYSAKVVDKSGNTQSNAVSPSSGSLDSGFGETLTVSVPSKTGTYKLVVEYSLDDEKVSESEYVFKAVNPIVLTVNLTAEDATLNLEEFGVYFYVDGQKLDDSYKTITLSADGTGSVSYDWIADPQDSKHTFYVEAVGGASMIKGLDEVHTFYTADNDYTMIIVLAFIILIALIIWAVVIYRRPIKNYGKPKARR